MQARHMITGVHLEKAQSSPLAFTGFASSMLLNETKSTSFQYNFETLTGASVDRETFMLVLVDLQALHIRASYYTVVTEVRLVSELVEMNREK